MGALDIAATRQQFNVCAPRRFESHHSARQVELIVNHAGIIADCSGAHEVFFEYNKDFMIGKNVSLIIPELAGVSVAIRGHINSRLRMLSRIGWRFKVKTRSNSHKMCHLFLSDISLHHEHYTRIVASELF